MKRIQWLRTEFTDGVVPDMIILSDANYGNNPELLRGYETVFNDSLAGNIEQRRRARVLPAGMTPMFTAGWDTKYKADFDEWLVKAICGHFGVLPTQLGFTPKSGLGGKGHQDGEANSAETIGLRPIIMWLTNLVNDLSYKFLGMPKDLSFSFTDGTEGDLMAQAMRRKVELEMGVTTLNEARAEMGKPLFTFPEADVPVIVAGANVIPMNTYTPLQPADANGTQTPGSTPLDTRMGGETPNGPANQQAAEKPAVNDEAKKELSAFVRWAKNPKGRQFEFKFVEAALASSLNALVAVDAEAARDLATVTKAGGNPKAGSGMEPLPPHNPAKIKAEQLRKKYLKRFLSVGLNPDHLAKEWHDAPSPDPTGWIVQRGVGLLGAAAVAALIDLYYESAYLGSRAASAFVQETITGIEVVGQPPTVDWQGYRPGNADIARQLLSDSFLPNLQNLVAQAPDAIDGMNHTRVKELARALADAVTNGLSLEETAANISDLLLNPDRAEMIANTEMMRAMNGAAMDVYQQNGIEEVEWITSGDANVCEDCLALEANNPYPIDAVPDDPPLHPNCGCFLEPVVPSRGDVIELAVEADLVKVHRQRVNDALDKLAKIPEVKDGLIAVPWDILERPKIDKQRWADSNLKSVEIEKLYASQKYLKRKNVEWHINHPGETHEGQNAYPNVLKVDGDRIIYDGHHRLAALWLLGAREANVWHLKD
jgi:SPP1 gp7 family putative phage head morphogenesis protein